MIVEVIFSTLDGEGRPNFAPMGVVWGESEMTVRPFRNTTTYRNLVSTGCGVANATDDVLLFVRTALSTASAVDDVLPPHFPARHVRGVVLEEACFWRELEVAAVGGDGERAEVRCRVVGGGRRRDFLGFNRGRNAIIEAAIIATRLHLHSLAEVHSALRRYDEIVRKTGGEREREAMQYVQEYVTRWFRARES